MLFRGDVYLIEIKGFQCVSCPKISKKKKKNVLVGPWNYANRYIETLFYVLVAR